MSLSTAKYFKDSPDTALQFNQETGWQEIIKGLGLVVWGYVFLVLGSLVGAGLIWAAVSGGSVSRWLDANTNPEDRDKVLAFGVLTLALTACLSYGSVLTGQWRCLMYAPQRQNAKELMYLCLNGVFLASVLNVVGAILDGARTYSALQHGWEGVEGIEWRSPGNLLQIGSAALGLFASLVFSQFLRNVASCFNDRARVRSVDFNLAFVGLLLGGTIGTLLYVRRPASGAEMLPWLMGGWLFCFAWHLWLVRSVRRCVEEGLQRDIGLRVHPAVQAAGGGVALHSLSGLRRLANRTGR
jgi:hypothetical protein